MVSGGFVRRHGFPFDVDFQYCHRGDVLPLALGLLSSVDKNDRGTRVFVLLAVAYSSSIGGMGMLQGSPPNGIAAKELGMGFTEWMRLGLPITFILMPAMFVTLWIVCKPNFKQKIRQDNEEDIPWTGIRVLTLAVFAVTALAWFYGDELKYIWASPIPIPSSPLRHHCGGRAGACQLGKM